MKTVHRTIVSAMLVTTDHKILLGKQRQGGVYPDCWHIPGGGADTGETKEQALNREIKEEVGIDISQYPKTLLSDTDSGTAQKTDKTTGEPFLAVMQFNTYQVDLPTTTAQTIIALNDDLTEFQWVAIQDLKNYKHTPPSEKLFKQLGYLP